MELLNWLAIYGQAIWALYAYARSRVIKRQAGLFFYCPNRENHRQLTHNLIRKKFKQWNQPGNHVDILIMIGGPIYGDQVLFLGDLIESSKAEIRILLANPEGEGIRKRSIETKRPLEWYRSAFQGTVALLDQISGTVNVEYRIYDSAPVFRLFIFEDELYVQSYLPWELGENTPMFGFKNTRFSLYPSFKKLLDTIWDSASESSTPKEQSS